MASTKKKTNFAISSAKSSKFPNSNNIGDKKEKKTGSIYGWNKMKISKYYDPRKYEYVDGSTNRESPSGFFLLNEEIDNTNEQENGSTDNEMKEKPKMESGNKTINRNEAIEISSRSSLSGHKPVYKKSIKNKSEKLTKKEKCDLNRNMKGNRINDKANSSKKIKKSLIPKEKVVNSRENCLALPTEEASKEKQIQIKTDKQSKENSCPHNFGRSIPSKDFDNFHITTTATVVKEDNKPEILQPSSTSATSVRREDFKINKKKLNKLKQRMARNAEQYGKTLMPLPVHVKRKSQVSKFLDLLSRSVGFKDRERLFKQLLRIIGKKEKDDLRCFWLLDGLGIISKILAEVLEDPDETKLRLAILAVELYKDACYSFPEIAFQSLFGYTIVVLMDALKITLQFPETKSYRIAGTLSLEIMETCSKVLSDSVGADPQILMEYFSNLSNYMARTGFLKVLSTPVSVLTEYDLQNKQKLEIAATKIRLVTIFFIICSGLRNARADLVSVIKTTELFSVLDVLRSYLITPGVLTSEDIIMLAAMAFNLLLVIAYFDIDTFQSILSDKSTKYLYVVSMLLKYSGSSVDNDECHNMLSDIIASVGFFCAGNEINQNILTANNNCGILLHFKNLQSKFNVIIFPCVFSIAHDNENAKKVLSNYFDLKVIKNYGMLDKNSITDFLKTTFRNFK